jgi:hypothetical protein
MQHLYNIIQPVKPEYKELLNWKQTVHKSHRNNKVVPNQLLAMVQFNIEEMNNGCTALFT